jgi:hypothetical protein
MKKAMANKLFDKLEEVVKQFAEENNLILEIESEKYSEQGIVGKFRFHEAAAFQGTKYEVNYKHYEKSLNLPPLGTVFKLDGEPHKIIGFNTRSRKYPIMGEEVNTGKKYKFSVEAIRNLVQ